MIKTNNVFLRYKALNRFINRANKNLIYSSTNSYILKHTFYLSLSNP